MHKRPHSLLSMVAFLPSAIATGPLAHTVNGTYEGLHLPQYNQDLFLGIPYAQQPVGPLRFQNAQSLNESFGEVRQAVDYGPECYGYGSDQWGYPQSESCLTLSITRPTANITSPPNTSNPSLLPVALWIHGGGYSQGGAADRRYNTSFLVQNSITQSQPILTVKIQYRLSAWGLLYSEEAAGAGIANNALKDQRLALRWVRENIAAFGGDPDKVSIWGESAGASSVGFHLLAYGGRDDGLFRGAVMESGNPVPYEALKGSQYYQPAYDALIANVTPTPNSGFSQDGIKSCADATDSLDCLRYVDVADLNNAINTTFADSWYPVIDGDFIRGWPSRQMERGEFVKVPIISGANSDEGVSFAPLGIEDDAHFEGYVTASQNYSAPPGITLPAPLVQNITTLYPNAPCTDIPQDNPTNSGNCSILGGAYGSEYKRAATYAGDVVFIAERRRTCRTWAAAGVPAYCYRFNAVPAHQSTAMHFQEVAFVFDNTAGLGYEIAGDPFEDKPATYSDLAETMSRSWVSFFATLDPDTWRNQNSVKDGASGGMPAVWENYQVSGSDIVWDANVTSYMEVDDWRSQMSVIWENAVAFRR